MGFCSRQGERKMRPRLEHYGLPDVSGLGADHPIVAAFVLVVVAIALLLGFMHEGRIFVDLLIPLIQHLKRECDEWRVTWHRLKRELTHWKSDEAVSGTAKRGEL